MPVVEANFCASRTAWATAAFGAGGTPLRALCSKNWRGKCTSKQSGMHTAQCRAAFSGGAFVFPIEWHPPALDAFFDSEVDRECEIPPYIRRAVAAYSLERVARVAVRYPQLWRPLRAEVLAQGPQDAITAETFMLLASMSAIPRACMPALTGITDAKKWTTHAARAEKYLRWLTCKEKIHPDDAPFLAEAIKEALAPLSHDTQNLVQAYLYAPTPALPCSI